MSDLARRCPSRAPVSPGGPVAGAWRRVFPAALSLFAAVLSCSSGNTSHPSVLGGCVPAEGQKCADPQTGVSGATTELPAAGAGANADDASTVVGCGVADRLVQSQSVYCPACIITNCCQADQLCDATCQSLLTCAQTCMPGDTSCVGLCENMLPTALKAYQDFATCVSGQCTPQCPTLQQ